MSAFIVSKKHVQTIALHYCENFIENYTRNDVLKIATILYKENVKSYNYRYNEKIIVKRFTKLEKDIVKKCDNWQLLKLVNCLNYQSCEHDEYKTSHAKSIIDNLSLYCLQWITNKYNKNCADLYYNHPLYDKAKWEI